jgi:hypothetical protein
VEDDSRPADWNPAELLLYAQEYLGLYILFAFKADDWDESYPAIAVSYLESSLDCIEDAQAALTARSSRGEREQGEVRE